MNHCVAELYDLGEVSEIVPNGNPIWRASNRTRSSLLTVDRYFHGTLRVFGVCIMLFLLVNWFMIVNRFFRAIFSPTPMRSLPSAVKPASSR